MLRRHLAAWSPRGAAFGVARLLRRGELSAPPPALLIVYAVVPVVVTVVGLGMSVSPGSSLGFLAFSREDTYDRMPNIFLPEVRQAMSAGGRPSLQGVTLLVAIALIVGSIVAAVRAWRAQNAQG